VIDRPQALTLARRNPRPTDDVLIFFFVFVAFDDVGPLHFLAALLAVALVSDRRKVALVQHRELESLALFRGEKLDRDVDQSERDRTFPE
jgi:hypothetical protein